MMKWMVAAGAVLWASAGPAAATVIGYWRFDEIDAVDGGAIAGAVNSAGNADLDGSPSGAPLYTASVPGPYIFDPVAGATYANAFALDATAANARVNVNGNTTGEPMDTASFTLEGFLRLDPDDLPTSFISFVSRRSGSNPYSGWQVDYNAPTFSGGGANANSGRIRARFDTMTNGVAYLQNQTTQGGLINDGEWHHFALSYNALDNRLVFFTDYVTNSTRLLSGPLSNQVSMAFGALSTFNVWMDEVRYSDSALGPDEFLVAIPEPGAVSLVVVGAVLMARRVRRRAD